MCHFEDESFQSVTCTGADNLTRTTKRQNTLNYTTQKLALVNSTTDTLKKIYAKREARQSLV